MSQSSGPFRLGDFITRWLFAFALVSATYNPTGYSYVGWLFDLGAGYFPVKLFIGICLLITYLFAFSLSFRALGWSGFALAGTFFVTLIWALTALGILIPPVLLIIVVEVILATILAIGISYAIFRQQVSGQATHV